MHLRENVAMQQEASLSVESDCYGLDRSESCLVDRWAQAGEIWKTEEVQAETKGKNQKRFNGWIQPVSAGSNVRGAQAAHE